MNFEFISFQAQINEEQIQLLEDLNQNFDDLHMKYTTQIDIYELSQDFYFKVLNSQLISRLGFVLEEMKAKQSEVQIEIVDRALEIGNITAACIVDAEESLENAINYAARNIQESVDEVMTSLNAIENDYFYPLINALRFESNVMQWQVLTALRRDNPITRIQNLITRLNDDYLVLYILYTSSMNNIDREVQRVNIRTNNDKSIMFPMLESFNVYFKFQANLIKDSLTLCNNTF